jgi:SAM-dependent methyltransferase
MYSTMTVSRRELVRQDKTSRSFDEIYGTNTAGRITVENLQIESANRKHGNPFDPVPVSLFTRLLDSVKVRHEDYVFLDLGSGKGRALLLASNYPFKQVIGVEYSQPLHAVALQNIVQYRSDHRRCFNVASVHIDATEYEIPLEPTICFFYNPFDETIMRAILTNFRKSLERCPRDIKFIYYVPQCVHLFDELGFSRDQLLLHEPTAVDVQEAMRDLSAFYDNLGDVQVARGKLRAAQACYQASFTVREHQAKSASGNAELQYDLSLSYAHLAYSHLLMANQSTEARDALAAGREIIARLVAQFPDQARWKQDLEWFDRQIAALRN